MAWYTDLLQTMRKLVDPVGEEGNAWKNEATGAGGDSAIVDISTCTNISIFGAVDAGTNLSCYFSQDGVNFYEAPSITAELPIVGDGATDFHVWVSGISARYIRLQSSVDVTATITVAGKP